MAAVVAVRAKLFPAATPRACGSAWPSGWQSACPFLGMGMGMGMSAALSRSPAAAAAHTRPPTLLRNVESRCGEGGSPPAFPAPWGSTASDSPLASSLSCWCCPSGRPLAWWWSGSAGAAGCCCCCWRNSSLQSSSHAAAVMLLAEKGLGASEGTEEAAVEAGPPWLGLRCRKAAQGCETLRRAGGGRGGRGDVVRRVLLTGGSAFAQRAAYAVSTCHRCSCWSAAL